MRTLAIVATLGAALGLLRPVEAHPGARAGRPPSFLLVDAVTRQTLDARWDDPDRGIPMGSLIKPFTALAYADTHQFAYPTFTCRGTADGCWLPAGHGRVGIGEAIAGSCNAYFHKMAQQTDRNAFVATLWRFGMPAELAAVSPAPMVGFGDALRLAPSAIVRAYLELVSREAQPGVAPIVDGMRASARTGTGRGAGEAMGGAAALVKTGTAPCSHSPRATSDGYAIVIYPADRPRVALLMQYPHGHTGAETAVLAGQQLTRAMSAR